MHTLRNSKLIANLVLAWFVLLLSAAIASPIVKPGNTQMVCSAGGGMKMVDMGDDGNQASLSLDCPLCTPAALLSPPVALRFEKISPLAYAMQPMEAAHISLLTAPPLPSRGPPVAFL